MRATTLWLNVAAALLIVGPAQAQSPSATATTPNTSLPRATNDDASAPGRGVSVRG